MEVLFVAIMAMFFSVYLDKRKEEKQVSDSKNEKHSIQPVEVFEYKYAVPEPWDWKRTKLQYLRFFLVLIGIFICVIPVVIGFWKFWFILLCLAAGNSFWSIVVITFKEKKYIKPYTDCNKYIYAEKSEHETWEEVTKKIVIIK